MQQIIFLSGLPRSGSTLACNLLAQHPEIAATPSSPLCHIIQHMRRQWSDDPFLLAQLDQDFGGIYDRLERSLRAFMMAWCEHDKPVVIDKNRGWLGCIETLRSIYPDFKMIVCLRDLCGVYASIERQHRRTLLLEFPDHMEHNVVDVRAASLFADGGIIGSPLKFLQNVSDIPNISSHLYFLRYEDCTKSPQQVLSSLTRWLGLSEFTFDLENICQSTTEADSYYRFKFPHRIKSRLEPSSPREEDISPRILREVRSRFAWYFEAYYPDGTVQRNAELTDTERRVAHELEGAL